MNTSPYHTLKIEMQQQIMILTINRPEKLNALSVRVLSELKELLEALENDFSKKVRGIILTGAGEKAFIAGADILEMSLMTADEAEEFSQLGQDVSQLFESLPIPVIGCVNGFALGGGCEMAMSCDYIYATETAVFGQPEVALGLIPCFGGCVRLLRYVGASRAKELIYSGRSITAYEANTLGLVSSVFATKEEMLKSAIASLENIFEKSYAAISICKSVINNSIGVEMEHALLNEKKGFKFAFSSDEKITGIQKFLTKKKSSEQQI